MQVPFTFLSRSFEFFLLPVLHCLPFESRIFITVLLPIFVLLVKSGCAW